MQASKNGMLYTQHQSLQMLETQIDLFGECKVIISETVQHNNLMTVDSLETLLTKPNQIPSTLGKLH